MAKRKRTPARKIPVRYNDGTTDIDYVARTPSELRDELQRVQEAILEAARILSRLHRTRHIVIKTARFQLEHALRNLPNDSTDEDIAAELARLSYLMEDTLNILNKLTHCRISYLKQARFKLTYGQTPKRREPPARYGKKKKE